MEITKYFIREFEQLEYYKQKFVLILLLLLLLGIGFVLGYEVGEAVCSNHYIPLLEQAKTIQF